MKRSPIKMLGELCDVEGGNAAPQGDENFKNGTLPFVRMKDLGRYHLTSNLTQTDDRLTDESAAINRMKIFEPGCILFPRSGSVALNHRAILGVRASIVSHIGVLRNFRPEIRSNFLYAYLTTFDMTTLSKKTTGVDSIAFSDVKRIRIPVPPLAEQDRIVRLLSEADQLRKLRGQTDRRTANLIPAIFHEMFGDSATNSKNLPIVPLGSVLSFKTGKLDSNAAVKDGAYPFFTCSREDARIDTFAFDCEALLLAGNNATGDYSVKHYKGKFNAYQRTYVLNLLNANHSYHFMQQALQLKLREFKRLSLGTNTKYLTLGILKKVMISLPDAEQQHEFAMRMIEATSLKGAQAASHRQLDALFQSLLHNAFNDQEAPETSRQPQTV